MMAEVGELADDLARGRMIVLMDDEDRENEGDLLIAAHFADADAVNFMATHGRGLICLALTAERCRRLGLAPQAKSGRGGFGTNFTVSIDAAEGVTTGTSAADRAATIRAATRANASASDLTTPGHVFPLMAADGGVLVRAGHTEAGCDLARMAGLAPAAVICEIMNPDGSMARRDDLREFAARHGLKVGAIKTLIERRLREEKIVSRESESEAQTAHGLFRLAAYRDRVGGGRHLAFWKGELSAARPTLTRVLVEPTALDGILLRGAGRSWSAAESLRRIAEDGAGVLLMLHADSADDGRLGAQLSALNGGAHPPGGGDFRTLRTYGIGAQILRDLGAGKIRLLSSRIKLPSMAGFNLEVTEIVDR